MDDTRQLRSTWKEATLACLRRYVLVDTTAQPGMPSPSSPGQIELGRQLMSELTDLGLIDIHQDQFGIVTATLPASPAYASVPTIGWLAHLDTSPEASSANVKTRVIRGYDGSEISFPGAPGIILTADTLPELAACIGHDLVFTDGSTLLGADDKSGIAAIMTAIEHLQRNPSIPHGRIRLAFTSDEEIGQGIKHLDINAFSAVAAYTLDGSAAGEIASETFSADLAIVRITGRNAHPGTAQGRMVSAVKVIADVIAHLPMDQTPETTDDRRGFLHPYDLTARVGDAELKVLLRDFDTAKLGERAAHLRTLVEDALRRRPGATGYVEVVKQYRNMADDLRAHPEIVTRLENAVRRAGLTPRFEAVRGGTDGSFLTERGLPCPNIFCGEHNAHAVTEWASLDDMADSVACLVELAKEWAGT